jgi:hypothetical protein
MKNIISTNIEKNNNNYFYGGRLCYVVFLLRWAPDKVTVEFSPGATRSKSTTKWLFCRVFVWRPAQPEQKAKTRQNDHFVVSSGFRLVARSRKYDKVASLSYFRLVPCRAKIRHGTNQPP